MVGFKWCHEVHHFSWSIVGALGDFVEVFLRVNAQIDTLGQVLPDETIDVFVCRAQPGTVRITETDLDFQLVSQFTTR